MIRTTLDDLRAYRAQRLGQKTATSDLAALLVELKIIRENTDIAAHRSTSSPS